MISPHSVCGFINPLGSVPSANTRQIVTGDPVIREFPPEHELLAFFESEPIVLNPDTPWLYNTLEFKTVRNDIEVRCRIVSSYGKITTRLMMGGQGWQSSNFVMRKRSASS
jgi:hypothetical protein